MRKFLTASLAALTVAGSLAAAGSADAQSRYRRHHHDNTGAAVAAGVAGLAIGAAIASSNNNRYYSDSYGRRQYRPGYYDGYYYGPRSSAYGYYGRDYGPRRCRTTTVYDPYIDAYVERTRCR